MTNILIVNGHDYYDRAQGKLTQTLIAAAVSQLSEQHAVQTTTVAEGYEVEQEIQKFQWADVIIFQTPIFWFSITGLLKKYIDDIYLPNIFFGKAVEFGRGGLLTDKKYMLSLTWGASAAAFSVPAGFLEGKSEDEVLFSVHKTQEYCGLKQLPTFSLYSSMREPDVGDGLAKLKDHLKKTFEL